MLNKIEDNNVEDSFNSKKILYLIVSRTEHNVKS